MVDPRSNTEMPFMIQYIFSDKPDDFIRFIEDVFGAQEQRERAVAEGTVVNALFKIAGNLFEISQARGKFPQAPHSFHLYTSNQDDLLRKAKEAKCIVKYELTEMDYGDSESWFIDPFGNNWFIATPIKT